MRWALRFVLVGMIGAAALPAQSFRERVKVDLVTVDLEATDKHGQPIRDLRTSELTLRIDGKVVPIEALESARQSLSSDTPARVSRPAPFDAAPAQAQSPKEATAPRGSSKMSLAILIDETSMAQFSKAVISRELSNLLDREILAGTELLLERYDGRLHVECPWTSDVAQIRAAAQRLFRRSYLPRVSNPGNLGQDLTSPFEARLQMAEINYHSRNTLDALCEALLVFPEGISGRKGLAFVTDGTPLLSPLALAHTLRVAAAQTRDVPGAPRGIRASLSTADAELERQQEFFLGRTGPTPIVWASKLTQIVQKAAQREILLFPVNSEAFDAGLPLFGGPIALSPLMNRMDVNMTMGDLAEKTGGEAILLAGHLAKKLRQNLEPRGGYLLIFRDPTPNEHRFHRLEISVARPKVKLRYRRGFQIFDPSTRLADRVLSQIDEPGHDNPLQAEVETQILERTKKVVLVRVSVKFPPLPEAGGSDSRKRRVEVVAVLRDQAGNRTEPLRSLGEAQPASDTERAALSHSFLVQMKPGRYTWRLGVRDEGTGVTSLLSLQTTL